MTDSERLESIKNGFGSMKYLHLDIKWLIKQSEKVERYEKALKSLQNGNEMTHEIVTEALNG